MLLGQEAWASFVSLGRIPKEVICFSCFRQFKERHRAARRRLTTSGVWMPPSINYMNMVDSLHNVGGLLNKYDVRRNIELIRTLYPEVENIAFISGPTPTAASRCRRSCVRRWRNYPDLNLVLVDSRDGDEASHAAYASLPPQSAVMLGTWRVGSDGDTSCSVRSTIWCSSIPSPGLLDHSDGHRRRGRGRFRPQLHGEQRQRHRGPDQKEVL